MSSSSPDGPTFEDGSHIEAELQLTQSASTQVQTDSSINTIDYDVPTERLEHTRRNRDALAGEACLILLYPPGPGMGKRFPLKPDGSIIGRNLVCDIQIIHDSVSRKHARLYQSRSDWNIEDLKTTNGSCVNEVPVIRSVLRNGDVINIGCAFLKFLSGSGIEASYHEEIYKLTIIDALTAAYNKRYFWALHEV